MSGIIGIVSGWFGASPASPRFAQPFKDVSLLHDFGEALLGVISDSVSVKISGGSIRTPANGTLRYIPKLDSLTDEKKAELVARWPELRRLDGSSYPPTRIGEGALLFEIWPSAFRRLEVMFSAIEAPIADRKKTVGKKGVPQTAVPRWLVFQGIDKSEVEARIKDIISKLSPSMTTSLASFFSGEIAIYVPFNSV